MLKVEDLYKIVCELEEEKYDWEMKIRRQEFEVCLSSLLVII